MNMQEFVKATGTTMITKKAESNPFFDGQAMNHYKVTIYHDKKQFTTIYSQGLGIMTKPTTVSVLECLVMDSSSFDNSQDIDDFINEFGYEIKSLSDMKKVESIYKACEETSVALSRLYTSEQLEILFSIES